MTPGDPPVMHAISPDLAVELLGHALERIAREHLGEGWCPELDYAIWEWTQCGASSPLSRAEQVHLKALATCLEGWIHGCPGEGWERVPLPQWLQQFRSWKEASPFRVELLRSQARGPEVLRVSMGGTQARRLVREELTPALEALASAFWRAKLQGGPEGAQCLGEAIRVLGPLCADGVPLPGCAGPGAAPLPLCGTGNGSGSW
nr:hypothetical protein [uncultured Holophaga sp.]